MTEIKLAEEAWEDVEDGTEALLDEWLVAEGDMVAAGQVIARVVLVKTSHEIEAPSAGRIAALEVPEEGNFGKGRVLARIEETPA